MKSDAARPRSVSVLRLLVSAAAIATLATSCAMDRAPRGLRRTPDGPGATVRYDLAHRPLPEIPLPIDTATWPDPTSRTGLRINASLVAPTNIEKQARQRFSELEGWGTFSPITVAFDVPKDAPGYEAYEGAALDIGNVKRRHQGDDYDFANDAIYVVNLETGIPVVLDVGAGNFNYTLKKLDKYWANDTRVTERNLLFETRDETQRGAITPELWGPEHDTDFDGVRDIPNLDDPFACPDPDLERCDNAAHPDYNVEECLDTRRTRDQCIADHLMYWYERETDTLQVRPLLPLDEMTRYAVVVTDRLVDGVGNPVKSPFEFVYHAAQEDGARRVLEILRDDKRQNYYGDIAGTGLDHVAFTWTFTTQPTVDDMKRLRDGLYGFGPFARWAEQYPPVVEIQRAIGLTSLEGGGTDPDGWVDSDLGKAAHCPELSKNLYVIKYDEIREQMRNLVVEGFGVDEGPGVELLLRQLDNIDYMLIGTYKSPFLLEGGPKSTDPNAAFHLNYQTGEVGSDSDHSDEVQFWLIVPKETEQFKQPFNVNVYGHGYTGYFVEEIIYAGNMAAHGLATIGINAMGHGVVFDSPAEETAAIGALGAACSAPFFDALTRVRARDLDNNGRPDSGGDFWSSYLFHTRDGVRQSILDHLQLVRLLRSWGSGGAALCRTQETGWDSPAIKQCDFDGDGKPDMAGDFNGDGKLDVAGTGATYGTWGESLGGILSGIHGAIDAYVTAAVPGSGGGGLTDIGIRSFQGGVIEAVLLRIWGPLVVTVPATERTKCSDAPDNLGPCTICSEDQLSLRWVMPDVNGTGEVEIGCMDPQLIDDTTVFVRNMDNDEVRCARVDDSHRFRIGIPSSIGDRVQVEFYDKKDIVKSYKDCSVKDEFVGAVPRTQVSVWGGGPIPSGSTNELETETCGAESCAIFQNHLFAKGETLTAPAEGFGQVRQTPASRRFIQLAQTALEPGDPVSFAPYYSIKTMTDPYGQPIAPHALLTLNTIGDMNVPLNSGIAFARASGALPFFRPDQATTFPEYANYATPQALYDALGGRTPNQQLIESHVIEGITALARHPAGAECEASANEGDIATATFLTQAGAKQSCLPGPESPLDQTASCTQESEADPQTRICYEATYCDVATGQCRANPLGKVKCDEALFDVDDLDEGKLRYYEQNAPVPQRLARYTQAATVDSVNDVWAPRLLGVPGGDDLAWTPDPTRRVTGLLDAYVVPEGRHTFENGNPCQSFDYGNYLTNLTARFFESDGTDVYYLSHPKSHHCLVGEAACGYIQKTK